MAQSKPGKRLGDLGSVPAPSGVLLAVPDLSYAGRQEIASSSGGSCWPGGEQGARVSESLTDLQQGLCTAQQDIPLQLWGALSVSDQSSNIQHPLPMSPSNMPNPTWVCGADSEGHALQLPPLLLSAQ